MLLAVGSLVNGYIQLWNTADLPNASAPAYTITNSTGSETWTFSNDSKTLIIGNEDGTIELFDIATSRRLATLTGHTDAVTDVEISPDGRTMASGSRDETLRFWNLAARKEIATLDLGTPAESLAFSPDGRTLAGGTDVDGLILWNVTTRAVIKTIATGGAVSAVTSVAYSPDGKILASGDADGTVKLWNPGAG
jgi:WD40 repeat protein